MSRRLGWLLGLVEADLERAPLRRIARPDHGSPTERRPGSQRRGQVDRGWNVRVNADIQAEV